ncbi:hypothetical protein DFH09DRAFT_336120 [Mycena vulgaris]|nr:hypothetical protein DFH09DRAFT_336120 [Mycena vulgaris]
MATARSPPCARSSRRLCARSTTSCTILKPPSYDDLCLQPLSQHQTPRPHAHVAAEQRNDIFVDPQPGTGFACSPRAFTTVAHGAQRISVAAGENSPHAFQAQLFHPILASNAYGAHLIPTATHLQRHDGLAYPPHTLIAIAGHTNGFAGMRAQRTHAAAAPWTEDGQGASYPRVLVAGEGVCGERGDDVVARGEDEDQCADARHAFHEEVHYVNCADKFEGEDVGIDDGFTGWMDDADADADASTSDTLHESESEYDQRHAQCFAGMCGVWACPFEAGLAFGAEFTVVAEDALAPRDGERVSDDASAVAEQQRGRDARLGTRCARLLPL